MSAVSGLEKITLTLDAEAVKAYKASSPEDQKRMQSFLSFWLEEMTRKTSPSLKSLMDQISGQARARGMTEEILNSILNEK